MLYPAYTIFCVCGHPILTFGCEVRRFKSFDIIENGHICFFIKRITKAKKATAIYMLHGELGRYPLSAVVKRRMIGYWNLLLNGKPTQLSYEIYLSMLHTSFDRSEWTKCFHSILYS